MQISRTAILVRLLGLTSPVVAFAKDVASVKIVSPTNNAQLDACEEYPLNYEVTLEPGGDHIHVWVDKGRGPRVHDSKGIFIQVE